MRQSISKMFYTRSYKLYHKCSQHFTGKSQSGKFLINEDARKCSSKRFFLTCLYVTFYWRAIGYQECNLYLWHVCTHNARVNKKTTDTYPLTWNISKVVTKDRTQTIVKQLFVDSSKKVCKNEDEPCYNTKQNVRQNSQTCSVDIPRATQIVKSKNFLAEFTL